MSGGPTVISRYSLDLIRQSKQGRGNAGGLMNAAQGAPQQGKDAMGPSGVAFEEMDLATLMALANYDDDEIERYLASC